MVRLVLCVYSIGMTLTQTTVGKRLPLLCVVALSIRGCGVPLSFIVSVSVGTEYVCQIYPPAGVLFLLDCVTLCQAILRSTALSNTVPCNMGRRFSLTYRADLVSTLLSRVMPCCAAGT